MMMRMVSEQDNKNNNNINNIDDVYCTDSDETAQIYKEA